MPRVARQARLLSPAAEYFPNVAASVRDALGVLAQPGHVRADIERVAVVGHSAGGVQTANYAVLATSEKLPVPKAAMIVEPGQGKDGGIKLIDWDTVALAPRGRDLWLLEPRTDEDWAAYRCATSADPAALALYRLRWPLTDICIFTATFRAPHVDDENTRVAGRGLRRYLEGTPE